MAEKLTHYPEALDTAADLPNIAGGPTGDKMDAPGRTHSAQHTKLNQAVLALQAKVGIDNSEDHASHEWRIKDLEEHGGDGPGGGGANLDEGHPDAVLNGSGPFDLPATPDKWLKTTIDGVDYVIPAFKLTLLEPAENLDADLAQLIYPARIKYESPEPLVSPMKLKFENIVE